ncbi:hypothetical protein EYF80_005621 [Liparis tanakae]|uniref:Uncharacterized protein n=1 Tax=Liparis tanakae TaxID=230148 RepID=A0A4Z2J368_9TELE|nr:hypothetical protein EYF80_005621 [Liparis tanakae]
MARAQEFNLKTRAHTTFTTELNVNHTVRVLTEHPQHGSCSPNHEVFVNPVTGKPPVGSQRCSVESGAHMAPKTRSSHS